jgi:hypothetical protein
MKKRRSPKWLLAAGALLLVIPLVAVACDSSGNDQVYVGQVAASGTNLQNNGTKPGTSHNGGLLAQRRQALKERRQARVEHRQALLKTVRDKMNASDQALFDQLTASIEQQRTAAQQARQKLADTLKELRTLIDKYLDVNDSGTD